MLRGRLGFKLCDGRVAYEQTSLEQQGVSETASSKGMTSASGAAEGSMQRASAAVKAASLLHLQHLSLKSNEMVASPAVGSQWWVERSAVQMNGFGGGHASAAAQRENSITADCLAAVQHISAAQQHAQRRLMSSPDAGAIDDAAALAALDDLLESLEDPPMSRAMPPPPAVWGHSKQMRLRWELQNGGPRRSVPWQDTETASASTAAPVQVAVAGASLNRLLEGSKGPQPARAVAPANRGPMKPSRPPEGQFNGARKRAAWQEDEAGSTSAAALLQDAKHVSVLTALQSAVPAGLADLWRDAGQADGARDAGSRASVGSYSPAGWQIHQSPHLVAQQTAQVWS